MARPCAVDVDDGLIVKPVQDRIAKCRKKDRAHEFCAQPSSAAMSEDNRVLYRMWRRTTELRKRVGLFRHMSSSQFPVLSSQLFKHREVCLRTEN